jgi:Ni,Fe-hydrogenase III component G
MKRSQLTYGTEVGSQLVKVDLNKFELYKDNKLNVTDKHYHQRIEEIKQEIIDLLEEKKWNDVIWLTIKFEPYETLKIHLYDKGNDEFLTTLISPTEWKTNYKFIGTFVLSSQSNTFRKI